MMKVSRGSKGFTLIELLIVVAIIGILAAIAIPAYTGYTAKSKIAGVVHSLGAIKNAIAAYYTESGAYPAAADVTVIKNLFGIDVPTQYATFSIAANAGVTALVQNVSGDTNGKDIVLTPDWTTKLWTWSSSNGMPATYLPKGS
jgi:type IV pilus assembly protein PilA